MLLLLLSRLVTNELLVNVRHIMIHEQGSEFILHEKILPAKSERVKKEREREMREGGKEERRKSQWLGEIFKIPSIKNSCG